MATNRDTPFGLKPVNKDGTPWAGVPHYYYVPSTYGTALFVGDPVIKTGTANTAAVSAPGAGSFDIACLPEVNRATVGDANLITGVVTDVFHPATSASINLPYNPASTEAILRVCDDPDAWFEIQADGAIPATTIGLNAVLIATHSGSTVTGLSGMELDTTSDVPAADASNQLLILRMVNRPDNVPNLIHNKVLVQINNHTEAHGALGL